MFGQGQKFTRLGEAVSPRHSWEAGARAAWERWKPTGLSQNGEQMIDLLPPTTRRPLAVAGPIACAIAGAASAGTVLLGCMAIGLAGWFASDAGAHGDTRDALRVGADAWLLAHGSQLQMEAATISVVPLGLTLFCAYLTFRHGRWAGATYAAEDARVIWMGTAVLAGVYGVIATATAVLASLEIAQPNLGRAFVGGFTLAFLAGGAGAVSGSGRWLVWRAHVPKHLLAVGTGAASVVLLMCVAGSVLVATALLLDFGSAANVLARLHADVPSGLMYTVVVATVVPNAVLLGGAYLLGPGFVVGSGTLVSPSAVILGPVPAFPLLAALPDEGATARWLMLLVAVPVVVGAVSACVMLRRFPVLRYDVGALRGLAAGVLGGLLFALATGLAGGSVGPGRMADVGALVGQSVIAAVVAVGVGGLTGGLAMTWWLRRGRTESA